MYLLLVTLYSALLYSTLTLIPCRYLSAALRCSNCLFYSTLFLALPAPPTDLLSNPLTYSTIHYYTHDTTQLLYCTVKKKVSKEHLVGCHRHLISASTPPLHPLLSTRCRCSSKWHLGHLAHYIAHCTLHSGDLQTRCDQPSSSSNLTCHTEHYLLLLVVLCGTYSLRKQTFHHSAVHAPSPKRKSPLYGLNGLYGVLAFITSWPHQHPLFSIPYYEIPTSDLRCTEASFETSVTTHIPRPRPGHPSRPTHSLISA